MKRFLLYLFCSFRICCHAFGSVNVSAASMDLVNRAGGWELEMFVIVSSTSSSSPRVISNMKPVVRDVVETLPNRSSTLIPGI